MQVKKTASATESEIRNILGPCDDDVIMAVCNTGATRDEVMQAFQWLEGEDPGKTAGKTMTAAIRNIYDILLEDQESRELDEC